MYDAWLQNESFKDQIGSASQGGLTFSSNLHFGYKVQATDMCVLPHWVAAVAVSAQAFDKYSYPPGMMQWRHI